VANTKDYQKSDCNKEICNCSIYLPANFSFPGRPKGVAIFLVGKSAHLL